MSEQSPLYEKETKAQGGGGYVTCPRLLVGLGSSSLLLTPLQAAASAKILPTQGVLQLGGKKSFSFKSVLKW